MTADPKTGSVQLQFYGDPQVDPLTTSSSLLLPQRMIKKFQSEGAEPAFSNPSARRTRVSRNLLRRHAGTLPQATLAGSRKLVLSVSRYLE